MKVLFYVPYSNIWLHSSVEAVLADQLSRDGHDVIVVRCKGLLNHFCPAMSEAGLHQDSESSKREQICSKCIARGNNIDSEYRFNSISLDSYSNSSDVEIINTWKSKLRNEKWADFEVGNIPLGRIAAYEFLLTNKLNSRIIPTNLWPHYLGQFINTANTYLSMQRLILDQKPEGIIVHNSLYSSNRVVVKIAEKLDIPTFHLGVGTDLKHYGDSFSLYSSIQDEIELNTSDGWKLVSSQPLTEERIKPVIENFLQAAKSKSAFTYSSKVEGTKPSELFSHLGMGKDLPVCVALLSSADERFAADLVGALPYSLAELDTLNFNSQIDWVKYLIDLFSKRDDIQLVIRVHPRLFPNKREKVLSEAGKALKEAFSELPDNVTINWPEDNIALYDLAQITDVCLNATSSAGGELLALGIPVVCHEPERLFSYPREFNIVPAGISDYESAIDEALRQGWTYTNTLNAFRWKAFQFNDVARSLAESLPLRSKWSLLRIANGIDLRTKYPVPQFILRFLERIEMKRRAKNIDAAGDLEDLITHNHKNLSEVCSISLRAPSSLDEINEKSIVLAARDKLYFSFFGEIPQKVNQ